MNSKRLLTTAAIAGALALIGCSSNHSPPPVGSTQTNPAPTNFAFFVNEQVQQQPALGTTPAATGPLNTNLALGDATAFASVTFGKGNAVPAGTFQAATACAAAGPPTCNPTVSADPNTNLN